MNLPSQTPPSRAGAVLITYSPYERYELAFWPLDFEAWPPMWIRVVACMSGGERSLDALCDTTGASVGEARACLAELAGRDAIRIRVAADAATRAAARRQKLPPMRLMDWMMRKLSGAP